MSFSGKASLKLTLCIFRHIAVLDISVYNVYGILMFLQPVTILFTIFSNPFCLLCVTVFKLDDQRLVGMFRYQLPQNFVLSSSSNILHKQTKKSMFEAMEFEKGTN